MSDHWKVVFEFHEYLWNTVNEIAALYFYLSTEQLKYSNYIVSSFKYLEENQEIHFRHHCQEHLIHHWPHSIINASNPVQNLGQTQMFYKLGQTRLTQTKRDTNNPSQCPLF